MKLLSILACLIVAVNTGTYGGQRTSLEDIERDNAKPAESSSYTQATKASSSPIASPTKFGFLPQRTATSYAASTPKSHSLQSNHQVKKSARKPSSSNNYHEQRSPYYAQAIPQQYSSGPNQQYASLSSGSDYAQQYIGQQQVQEYAYVHPEANQQYTLQYQQPSQQYEQYENVQYVSDNSLGQSNGQQYYSEQPQYYYVQSPSTAAESVVDPKAVQYVMYIPSYATNAIPTDQKYLEQYSSGDVQPQLPPITNTVTKYTTVVPSGKSSSIKQYGSHSVQYAAPSPKEQYQQQEVFRREPKSLLDSYVPSYLQLQYLRQQGKGYSKY